jgi:hypothetical protein
MSMTKSAGDQRKPDPAKRDAYVNTAEEKRRGCVHGLGCEDD